MGMGISAMVLGLGASILLTLSVQARSVGLAKPANRLRWMALAMLASSPAIAYGGWWAWPLLLAALGAAAALSMHSARAAARAGSEPQEPGVAPRMRRLGIRLWATAALIVAAAAMSLSAHEEQMYFVVPAFIGLSVMVGVNALRMAERHAARGREALAWLGCGLALWSVCAWLLPVLAIPDFVAGWFGVMAAVGFPVAVPLVTRLLLGKGPVPLDIAGETVVKSASNEHIVVALLGVVALSLQLLQLGKHYQHCGGELVPASERQDWQNLPVIAEGDWARLGSFNVRARRLDYKGYPAEFVNAELSDPKLCFASTVSLGSWFDGDMYRLPSELRLRRDDDTHTFFVSGRREPEGEVLVAAFTRLESPRWQLDSTLSRGFIVTGSLLLALGLACSALSFRLGHQREVSGRGARLARFGAAALFVASTCTALLLAQTWALNSTPRPGRELAIHYPLFI